MASDIVEAFNHSLFLCAQEIKSLLEQKQNWNTGQQDEKRLKLFQFMTNQRKNPVAGDQKHISFRLEPKKIICIF